MDARVCVCVWNQNCDQETPQSDYSFILSPETIVIVLLFLTQNVGWGGGMLAGATRGLWESGLQARVEDLGSGFQI